MNDVLQSLGMVNAGAATQLPTEVSSPPQVVAAPACSGGGRFAVKLKDNPRLVIEAGDRLSAREVYMQRCGIIRTEHEFTVEETTDPVS